MRQNDTALLFLHDKRFQKDGIGIHDHKAPVEPARH